MSNGMDTSIGATTAYLNQKAQQRPWWQAMPNRSSSQAELLSSECDLQEVVELFEIINLFNELSFLLTFQIVIEYALSFVNILAIISEVADKGCHPIHFSLIVCYSLRADCFTLCAWCPRMPKFYGIPPELSGLFQFVSLNSSFTSSHVNMIYPFAHRAISHSWAFWMFIYSRKAASVDVCRIIGENLDGSGTTTENKPFCPNENAPPFSSSFHSRNTKILGTWPCSIMK